MAQDIFKGGRQSNGAEGIGGVFNGTEVTISVGKSVGNGIKGALVQQIQIGYQRQISRLNEIGSELTYYIIGRSQGSFALSSIVGPSNLVNDIVDALSDACQVKNSTLTVSATQNFCANTTGSNTGSLRYTLTGAIATNIGMSISVQDFTIVQNVSGEFATLSRG